MLSTRLKAWLAALAVTVTMSGVPGWAQQPYALQVQPIVFRKVGQQLNMRVEVRNVSVQTIHAPAQVRLLARRNRNDTWHLLRSWDFNEVPSGQLVARDYLPVPPLDPALQSRHPLVRAEVWVNGQTVSATEVTTGHSEAP